MLGVNWGTRECWGDSGRRERGQRSASALYRNVLIDVYTYVVINDIKYCMKIMMLESFDYLLVSSKLPKVAVLAFHTYNHIRLG